MAQTGDSFLGDAIPTAPRDVQGQAIRAAREAAAYEI